MMLIKTLKEMSRTKDIASAETGGGFIYGDGNYEQVRHPDVHHSDIAFTREGSPEDQDYETVVNNGYSNIYKKGGIHVVTIIPFSFVADWAGPPSKRAISTLILIIDNDLPFDEYSLGWRPRYDSNDIDEVDGLNKEQIVAYLKKFSPHLTQGKILNVKRVINLGESAPFQQQGIGIVYQGENKRALLPARARDDVLTTIPTDTMEAGFKKDATFYVGPGGSGAAIGNRYERFKEFLNQNETYEVPEVYVDERGRVVFTNGRHRYAVLRDSRIANMPVALSKEGYVNAKKLGWVK
jgi:hypothetical protein